VVEAAVGALLEIRAIESRRWVRSLSLLANTERPEVVVEPYAAC
jgi:hypothetical protein